jgi:hypothetical protein
MSRWQTLERPLVFDMYRGSRALVSVLFEHKSSTDRWVSFQLLRYMVRIWERCRHENSKLERLPANRSRASQRRRLDCQLLFSRRCRSGCERDTGASSSDSSLRVLARRHRACDGRADAWPRAQCLWHPGAVVPARCSHARAFRFRRRDRPAIMPKATTPSRVSCLPSTSPPASPESSRGS